VLHLQWLQNGNARLDYYKGNLDFYRSDCIISHEQVAYRVPYNFF